MRLAENFFSSATVPVPNLSACAVGMLRREKNEVRGLVWGVLGDLGSAAGFAVDGRSHIGGVGHDF